MLFFVFWSKKDKKKWQLNFDQRTIGFFFESAVWMFNGHQSSMIIAAVHSQPRKKKTKIFFL